MKEDTDKAQKKYRKNQKQNKALKDLSVIRNYVEWAFWIWIVLSVLHLAAEGTMTLIFQ